MGGNQSNNFDQKLFASQWQRKQSNYGGRAIWKNKASPEVEIQQYPIYANTQHDIQRQTLLFNLRKNSDQLVSATHLKSTVKAGLCSSAAQGRLFLQRIPLNLQGLQHIPFPDILNLHFNALNGYKKLAKVVGPFRPQQQQIGFNLKGQTKVWLNSDFSASNPVSKQGSEAAMVRNILQIIQDNTDNTTTPRQNPSIINYIYRNQSEVNFDDALISVRQFANQYNNGIIPKRLQCIQQVGIQTISRSLIELKDQKNKSTFKNQSQNLSVQRSSVQHSINLNQPTINTNTVYAQNRVLLPHSPPPAYMIPQPITNQNSHTLQYRAPQIGKQNINFNFGGSRVQKYSNETLVFVQPTILTQPVTVSQQPLIINQQPNLQQPVSNAPQIAHCPIPNKKTFIQSQVQTVRPVYIMGGIRPPQEQKVFQQIIRQPVQQSSYPVNQPIGNQIPVGIIPNSIPVIISQNQNQTQVNSIPNNGFVSNQKVQIAQNSNSQGLISQNKLTQQVVQINTLSQQSTQNNFSKQAQYQNKIQSKTFVADTNNPVVEKLWNANNNFETKDYNSYSSKNLGLQFNSASSRYKQVNLQDGKSSQALLAELRGLSFNSGSKYQTNLDSYKYESSNNYNFDSYKPSSNLNIESQENYGLASNQVNSSEDNNLYNTFTRYAKGGQNLQDNLQMKYSMTQQLYDNQPQNYQYQSHSREQYEQYEYPNQQYQYQQEGQYHVDYDPEILADIQRMNK